MCWEANWPGGGLLDCSQLEFQEDVAWLDTSSRRLDKMWWGQSVTEMLCGGLVSIF